MVRVLKRFLSNQYGGSTMQTSLLLGGIALAFSVLASPYLEGAVQKYAETRSLGVDRVITSSIEKGNRVVIRKSVLDPQGKKVCDEKTDIAC